MIEIKHRYTQAVLYRSETAATIRGCLEMAAAAGADLRWANLYRAHLTGAHLTGANLHGADLYGAHLYGAHLSGANLSGANLSGANLRWADLREANLSGANLRWANLYRAHLTGANLSGADLREVKDDIREILSAQPAEVPGLFEALRAGKVDGLTYEGECACLVGTIANVAHVPYDSLAVKPDSSRPAEVFFLGIAKGDTPETNPIARLAAEWIEEWLSEQGV